MAFVLVPVPEEHVEEFNRYMLGLQLVGQANVPPEALVAARDALSPIHRQFFEVVCRTAAVGDRIGYPALADAVGVDREVVLQMIMEINQVFSTVGAPACVLTEPEVTTLPDGTVRVQPVVLMLGAVARTLSIH